MKDKSTISNQTQKWIDLYNEIIEDFPKKIHLYGQKKAEDM